MDEYLDETYKQQSCTYRYEKSINSRSTPTYAFCTSIKPQVSVKKRPYVPSKTSERQRRIPRRCVGEPSSSNNNSLTQLLHSEQEKSPSCSTRRQLLLQSFQSQWSTPATSKNEEENSLPVRLRRVAKVNTHSRIFQRDGSASKSRAAREVHIRNCESRGRKSDIFGRAYPLVQPTSPPMDKPLHPSLWWSRCDR